MPLATYAALPRYTMPDGSRVTALSKLGKGSFGTTFEVRVTKPNGFTDTCCLKVVKFDYKNKQEKQWAFEEVRAMEKARHDSVVELKDHWLNDSGRLCILMELCTSGSLQQLINKHAKMKKTIGEVRCKFYMEELAGALSYLHDDLQMAHRDIKPDNVLVDEFGTLKLADFGLAKINTNALFHTHVGTPLFLAPEQLAGEGYTFAADVWALGCVLYELMALRSPWLAGNEPQSVAAQLVKQRIRAASVDWQLVSRYSAKLIDAVAWTLDPQPASRASAAELVRLLELGSRPSPQSSTDQESEAAPHAPTKPLHSQESNDLRVEDLDFKVDDDEPTPAQKAAVAIQVSYRRRSFARRERRDQREARRRALEAHAKPGWEKQADGAPDVTEMALLALQQAEEATRALEDDAKRVYEKCGRYMAPASKRAYNYHAPKPVDVLTPQLDAEQTVRMRTAAEIIQMQIRTSFERRAYKEDAAKAAAKADAHSRRQERLQQLAKPRLHKRAPPPPPPLYYARVALPPQRWKGAW